MKYFPEQIAVFAIIIFFSAVMIPFAVDTSISQSAAVIAPQCKQYQSKTCSKICTGRSAICRPCCECKGMVANKGNTGCNAKTAGTKTPAATGTGKSNTGSSGSGSWTECFFGGAGCTYSGSGNTGKGAEVPAIDRGGWGIGDAFSEPSSAPAPTPTRQNDCRRTGCSGGQQCVDVGWFSSSFSCVSNNPLQLKTGVYF